MVEIVATSCTPKQESLCHANLLLTRPTLIGVLHIAQNHILTFSNEYDSNGGLIDNRIHDLAWALGGVVKYDNDRKIILPPNKDVLMQDLGVNKGVI